MMAVYWHLTFLRWGQVCFPRCICNASPLKPLGQFCSNFMCSLLWAEEWKLAKMVAVHWPRWPPCPYMVKIFKNLLLQNRGHLGAESLHKSLGIWGLPKMLKWWSYIDIWPFYGEVKFASLCICMGTTHVYGKCMGKMLRISNDLSSEASWPMLLKFHVEPSWGRGTIDC